MYLAACDANNESGRDAGMGDIDYPLDQVLTLNYVQAKGTHNSYHIQPRIPFDPSHCYSHKPLDAQLQEQGVRQFELDLHLRVREGFEVFHVPVVDEKTTCRRFVDCLTTVREWSDVHPWHMPIVIWVEPKDDFVLPPMIPIAGHWEEFEAEILSVWPEERIVKPDEVRKGHATLPDAIAAEGWPTLGELRGRVIFSLLDTGTHREEYTEDAPALEGQLMFVASSEVTDSFAAFFKVNNAQSEFEKARMLVESGFIVTSNVDGVEWDDERNAERLMASLDAGVHFLSSDLPGQIPGRDYWCDLPDGDPARCNPVYDIHTCTPADIERLHSP